MASETFADELRAAVAGDKFTLYTELMLQAAELLDHKDEQINTRPAPAATDTGLVTVAHMAKSRMGWVPAPHWSGEAVCLRSQAEELLAAERAKYRDAMEKLVESQRETLVWQQRAIDLKSDNAAKDK